MMISRQLLRTLSQAQRRRHSSAAFIFILLIISTCLPAGNIRAQTVAPPSPQVESAARDSSRAQSTVRGRVVYDDTLRPLRRVRVTIYDPSGGNSNRQYRTAWTDGNGEFIFKNIFAGKYYVVVDAPGIIRQEVFESGADVSDVATASVNGINSAEVKVRVRRGAVISGKVAYSDGDPVINATVNVMRKKDGQMIPFYISEDCGNGIQTDERGFYRVSGLLPGEYVVGAAEQKMNETLRGNEEGTLIHRALLALTYYDGSATARGATPVQVEAGNEINNINITLIERSTHSVSGTLTMRGTNRPVTRARVSLDGKDDPSGRDSYLETQVAVLDEKGHWAFDDVVDGNYTITVAPMRDHQGYTVGSGDSDIPADGVPQSFITKRQDVTIGGNDLTGLAIELSTGGRIYGTVTVEGGQALPPNISISAEAAIGEKRVQLPAPAQIRLDGTFTVDGMPPDGVWIRAVSWRDKKYYTKSVTANGVDLMNEPLIVKDGSEVKGVRIVISPEVATLTGRILVAEGGAPLRGASILLVRAEPHMQRLRSSRLHGYTNADGGFILTGAPGEYLAIVIRPGVALYGFSDDSIKARLADAQRITLQPNERKKMDFIAPDKK